MRERVHLNALAAGAPIPLWEMNMVMHGDVYSKRRDESSGEERGEVKGAGVYAELCSTRGKLPRFT